MNMKLALPVFIIATASTLFSGCAPMISGAMNLAVDEQTLTEKTAKHLEVSRESVSITSIEKNALTTTYQAKNAGKTYNCTIYYGDVNCKLSAIQQSSTNTPRQSQTQAQAVPDSAMSPEQAQVRLNQLGYNVGTPDGVFGKKSIEKLKLFQKSRGLVESGKLDAPTISALRQ